MPLNSATVSRARAKVKKLLPQSVTLLKKVTTQDDSGGPAITWLPMVQGVPCYIQPFRPQHTETVVNAVANLNLFQAFIPWDVPVETGWRLIHDAYTYEIQGLSDDEGNAPYKSLDLARVDGRPT